MKAQAALEAAQAALVDLRNKEAEVNAVLAVAEKQKADAEKKRADVVLFEISGANGLVCRCHIPTAAVAQRGLFRILLGSPIVNYHSTMTYESGITDVTGKYGQGEDYYTARGSVQHYRQASW